MERILIVLQIWIQVAFSTKKYYGIEFKDMRVSNKVGDYLYYYSYNADFSDYYGGLKDLPDIDNRRHNEVIKATEKPRLECYNCYYSQSTEAGKTHGTSACDDPFRPAGIPVIACSGQCSIMHATISDDERMVLRGCMEDCHNTSKPFCEITCCTNNRCNGQPQSTNAAAHLGYSLLYVLYILDALCS